jgi:leucyl aminopeptidase
VRLTKDLVNAPANFATPRALADTARAISQVRVGVCVCVCIYDLSE